MSPASQRASNRRNNARLYRPRNEPSPTGSWSGESLPSSPPQPPSWSSRPACNTRTQTRITDTLQSDAKLSPTRDRKRSHSISPRRRRERRRERMEARQEAQQDQRRRERADDEWRRWEDYQNQERNARSTAERDAIRARQRAAPGLLEPDEPPRPSDFTNWVLRTRQTGGHYDLQRWVRWLCQSDNHDYCSGSQEPCPMRPIATPSPVYYPSSPEWQQRSTHMFDIVVQSSPASPSYTPTSPECTPPAANEDVAANEVEAADEDEARNVQARINVANTIEWIEQAVEVEAVLNVIWAAEEEEARNMNQ